MDFCCPICRGELLLVDNKVKRCLAGHSFDRAKEGYYNLLVGKNGGTHGDNADMVLARRAFLSRGHYEPLRQRVVDTVLSLTPIHGTVLDIGAGEGYYTDAVERALYERDGSSNVLAFDISKDAIKRLSRLNPRISTSVASSYNMPLLDSSVDLAMLLFSPLCQEEILRSLKPRAKFLMVFPDEMHLYGLKSAIYKTPYRNTPESTELEGFSLLSDTALSYEITLGTTEEIRELFMMTPYAYRTSPADRDRLLSNKSLSTEVAFRILAYEKN